MLRKNLLSLFADFARFGGDVAVMQRRGYRREKLTYQELFASANFWSCALTGRGVVPGDRVLLWGPNSAEWVACFWGILLRGAVVVPMDAAASPDFVQRAFQDAGVRLILRDHQQIELPGAPPSMIINDLKDVVDSLAPTADRGVTPGDTSTRSTVAEILYTSGTTAEPRGVVLTHGNFLANLEPLERGIEAYRKYERWFHPLRFVTLVPLSHVFGQFMALFVPPILGAAVVFEPSSNPAEIIRTIKQERAIALIAVPRMLDLLHAGIEREFEGQGKSQWLNNTFENARGRKFLKRAWMFHRIHRRFGWKFWTFISGGAALSRETEDFFKRIGYAVVQGYGMTETASLISLNHPFRATAGSVGKILPGRECKLAEDGEILVRGENVSSGYWEQGAVRSREPQGWLPTGDLGELDEEGNLRFRGRKKNVIVTPAGLNVYPEDLEATLRKQPSVRDCAVVPFERGGNAEPCAVLLLKDTERTAARSAIESANSGLAEYQRVRMWIVWPDLDFPRTPTGKPRLSIIAARAAQILDRRQVSDPESVGADFTPPSSSGSALDQLLERFSISSGGGARVDNHLERELNLSSLDRVELLSTLEERFHVELNETAFADAKTVADVERALEQPAAHRTKYRYPRWTQREPMRWLRLAVYYALVWPATQILGHPRIVGRENLRCLRGRVLIVSNHITRRADIGLILAALPPRYRHRLATAMGGETLQDMRRPPRDWFFVKRWAYQFGYWLATLLFNVFPLPQFSGFRESFRFAGESVDRGYSVLVFPEGEVNNSATGEMAPFQNGIGLLTENLRVPVVPMRLDGVWQMKREHRRLAHFGEVTVRIGTPVTFPPGMSPNEIARRLEWLVRSL
ncbi:MAG: AMP-dependent synthetase and ligase [Candidatus Acidoferrum typicum]|nr:AMP-dependent synthetase and ligase [Candidatus Acidoferrum typicum]